MNTPIDQAARHFGGYSALARALKVTPGFITQVRKNKRKLPLPHALQIDRDTGGAVPVEAMRPDIDWRRGRDIAGAKVTA